MTKRECAIITAYTGYSMFRGEDVNYFYRYAEELLDHQVQSVDLVWDYIWSALHERSKEDFKKLCEGAVEEGEWPDEQSEVRSPEEEDRS